MKSKENWEDKLVCLDLIFFTDVILLDYREIEVTLPQILAIK
jgi:hypothetical protein